LSRTSLTRIPAEILSVRRIHSCFLRRWPFSGPAEISLRCNWKKIYYLPHRRFWWREPSRKHHCHAEHFGSGAAAQTKGWRYHTLRKRWGNGAMASQA